MQNGILLKITQSCPLLQQLVVVEEKYSFTPDSMKAATQQLRHSQDNKASIGHLKVAAELVSATSFDKKSVVTTAAGRKVISSYLAANVSSLTIKQDLTLFVDSELTIATDCQCDGACACMQQFAVPLKATFNKDGFQQLTTLTIKQRKGEAEMAQLDWLIELLPSLKPHEPVISFVTSGDIDAVILHIFMVSNRWPRQHNVNFINPVYVVLQKSKGSYDVYNITAIVRTIETLNGQKTGMYVALVLCMGGNDFLPKYHGITHSKLLTTVVNERMLHNLFEFTFDPSGRCISGSVVQDVYMRLLKCLYCPPRYDAEKLTFDEVRQNTVKGF